MNPALKEAFDDMLAALKQCTSRADKDMKEFFHSRTDQCSLDYAQCMKAITKAELALSKSATQTSTLYRNQLK